VAGLLKQVVRRHHLKFASISLANEMRPLFRLGFFTLKCTFAYHPILTPEPVIS
jgi:hypothetical protein